MTSQHFEPADHFSRAFYRVGIALMCFMLDVLLVFAFAISGRSSHSEEMTLSGLWITVWPFLAALVISWLLSLPWARPASPLRAGVPLWIGTLAIGMILRVLYTPGGAALPFVLVAAGTLLLLLVGWRLLAVGLKRLFGRKVRTQ